MRREARGDRRDARLAMLEKIGHFTGHRHRVVGVRLIGPSRRGLRNRVIDVFEPLPVRCPSRAPVRCGQP